MIAIVLRKMMSNKWMLICTLLGSIITVAMLSSIPTYTDGIMQRMLVKDMEAFERSTGKFSGGYYIGTVDAGYDSLSGSGDGESVFKRYDSEVSNDLSKSIKLPLLTQSCVVKASYTEIMRQGEDRKQSISIKAMRDMKNHIKITNGKLFSQNKQNGVYEVILSENAAKELGVVLDGTYEVPKLINSSLAGSGRKAFKIKVVGIFSYKDTNDPYWFHEIGYYNDSVFMDFDLFTKSLTKNELVGLAGIQWFFAYDYHKLNLAAAEDLSKTFKKNKEWMDREKKGLECQMTMIDVIKGYGSRQDQLKIMLLVIQVPILIMLAFYSFMVSKHKIDFESNEIAVIKSRGGSGALVFAIYLIECLIIGVISMLLGPLLGLYLCKILGASNGFLEFVQRLALPVKLDINTYIYSLAAVIFISLSMLIPAFLASRTSIVLYKQKKNSGVKSFWQKYFLDVICLAVSFYGLYNYKNQQKMLILGGIKAADAAIDPLLLVISTLFIIGCSLVVIRIFPHVVRLIYFIGRKLWSPVLYASLIQVSRNSVQGQYVMIFIILTLSIGIFSANSARTINQNMEEKIRYETGADIVVEGHWTNNKPYTGSMLSMNVLESMAKEELQYYEPPFEPYKNLSGIKAVTKVLKREAHALVSGNDISNVSLMGIIPHEFGKVAWFRTDLLPHHWYQYLNLMTDSPRAVLLSKSFKDNLKVNEGDAITLEWGDGKSINGVVYAFVEYWPSMNPNKQSAETANPYFAVANLNYIQNMTPLEPYDVWLKKAQGASSNQVYQDMANKNIVIDKRIDATELLIKKKNDPIIEGTNGSLTLGFIVTVVISIIGFLIYWIMSIKKRVLQFGVFRAMGLSLMEVMGMLISEQILITGYSILSGIFIGQMASSIFVPMLQMAYGAAEQVPPFRVISYAGDYLRLYIVFGLMIIFGLIILGSIVSRINVSQALKLGED